MDNHEKKIEKLESQLSKIRGERSEFANVMAQKINRSRKIAKAMLSKADAKDFLKPGA